MKGFVHCVFRFDLALVLLSVGFNSCSFASWFLFVPLLVGPFPIYVACLLLSWVWYSSLPLLVMLFVNTFRSFDVCHCLFLVLLFIITSPNFVAP